MIKKDKISVSILINEGFPALSLTLVTEPLRVANRESRRPLFEWRIISPGGQPTGSSSGLVLPVDGGLDDAPADVVLVLTSYNAERMATGEVCDWLRRRAAGRVVMGSVDTGAIVFARAGLLKTRPAAVHHEAIVGFRERYGEDLFTDTLFDVGADRCSSAGGVVTFDMTLGLIERLASRRLARRVAEVLNYRPLSSGMASGAFGRDWSIPRLDRTLGKAIEIMIATIENPLPITEIAKTVGWPVWKLRRAFQKHMKMSAQAYYLELRLDRARNLLRNSNEKVGTIALMCGFPASESLSRAYAARFGVPPSRDRALG